MRSCYQANEVPLVEQAWRGWKLLPSRTGAFGYPFCIKLELCERIALRNLPSMQTGSGAHKLGGVHYTVAMHGAV